MYRKIIYTGLFVVLLLFSACSALRKNVGSNNSSVNLLDYKSFLPAVKQNNISQKSFKISRFRAEIINSLGDKRSVSGFLKYSKKGDVLISLRSMAGIEVARGLLDSDSIRVYDRINKILYLQSNKKFGEKYGLNKSLIELVWGDLPQSIIESSAPAEKELMYCTTEDGRVYNYNLNKKVLKLSDIESWLDNKKLFRIEYGEFKVNEDCIYPAVVNLDLAETDYSINLTIKGISIEKPRNMNFKVDKGAERIILK